jgi:hypothetical protein
MRVSGPQPAVTALSRESRLINPIGLGTSGADDLRLLANDLFYDANDERDPHPSLAFAAPTAVADKRIRKWSKIRNGPVAGSPAPGPLYPMDPRGRNPNPKGGSGYPMRAAGNNHAFALMGPALSPVRFKDFWRE